MSSSAIEALFLAAPELAEGCRPSTSHIMVRCPFHGGGQEKEPSCAISASKPVFFCHGCKESGHLSRMLRHAGVSESRIEILLPRVPYESREQKTIGARLVRGENPFKGKYILDDRLLDAYRTMPLGMRQLGFKAKTLRHFEVGFDNAHTRATFPLRNVYGDLVGISGRSMVEGETRYRIYDRELKSRTDFPVPKTYSMEEVKSSILWHAHVCRPLFFQPNSGHDLMITLEGFKATMWVWQAGHEDVVALIGSYMSDAHAELLARASRNQLLFLDNNEAGFVGTIRAASLLINKGCRVYVARYPDEREQPDQLTYDEIFDAINDPLPFFLWKRDHRMPESLKKWTKRRSG